MARIVQNINVQILRQCREQMGISIDEVAKKVKFIANIEAENKKPTFKQLDTLADLYSVPRWVFISDELPSEYLFDSAIPALRQFFDNKKTNTFKEPSVRRLVARVERFRGLIIELKEDADELVTAFDPPELQSDLSLESTAVKIREWLGVESSENFEFSQWKEKLEQKNIFVFMTSKYRCWSHIDKDLLRGLAIYHSTLPIIIINDSDAKRAKSFTLFHELGHLISKESAIDDWNEEGEQEERWCDNLSGEVLMPADRFPSQVGDIDDVQSVKNIASRFKVSPYACLVRLRNLDNISQSTYSEFKAELQREYDQRQQKLKSNDGGPSRNRAKEVLDQYGRIYINALFQAHYQKEITLHKLCRALDLKQTLHISELERDL